MAEVQDVIRRLIIEAQTRGLDKAEAGLRQFADAGKDVASAADAISTSTTKVESSLASTSRSFDRVANSVDPVRKQIQALAKDLDTLEKGRGRGGMTDEAINSLKEMRTAQANTNIEMLKMGPGLAQQTAAMGQHAQAARLSAYEMKNLGFQLNDAVTMLGTGSSAFQVAASQGGQVLQVLQGGGGLVANVKDLGTRFLGLVTPATAAFAAIATGAVAAAVGMSRLAEQEKEAQQALGGGRGRFLQATPQDLAASAERSRAVGTSIGESRAGILAGVRAGAPDLRSLEQANSLAQRYAATIQSELVPAQKQLADLIGDRTTASYASVSRSLRAYNADVEDNIKQLQGQGKFGEAAKLALDSIEGALLKNETATTAAGRAWAYFVTQIEKGIEVAGRGAAALAPPMPGTGDQRAIAQQSALSRPGFDTAIKGETGRSSTRQGDDARALAEELRQVAEATGQANAAAAKSAADAALIQTNLDNAIRKATEAQRDQIAVMNAFTVEQRAAATQTQVYNQVFEKTGSVQEATARAELAAAMVRAQAVAEMQKAIQVQELELAMGPRLVDAATQQGAAGVALRAGLQEEMALRKAGIDTTTAESQARIANAEAIARQNLAIQDAAQARSTEMHLQNQLESLRLEAQLINATTEERARATSALQTEIQAREAEAQGLEKTAAKYREYKDAIASAAAQKAGGGGVYDMAGGGDPTGRAGDLARFGPITALGDAANSATQRLKELMPAASETGMKMEAQAAATERAAASANRFASALDGASREAASASFAAGMDKPMSQRGGFTSSIVLPPGVADNLDRVWGKGAGTSGGNFQPDQAKSQELAEQAAKQSEQIATQALQSSISIATRALSKQIQAIQEAASEQLSIMQDAAQGAADALSAAADKRQQLETSLKEQEDKRQARIQNYLAAGPSATEKNADIFYDPKTRMAFAETIAGNTDELLVAQLAAAKAQEDAAKDADNNAKDAVKAAEANQKAAEQQVKQLEAQQQELENQTELLSAGLDINSGISNNVLSLINVVKGELPASIAEHMSALMGITGAKAQIDTAAAVKDAPISAKYAATGGAAGSVVSGISSIGGVTNSLNASTSLYATTPTVSSMVGLRPKGFASGGEFTVPGAYGAGDRPFVVGLAGQERVSVQTPAQQAAARRGSGTQIQNLIVQMPPATNPIEYLNKHSRPALGRAVRGMARGMQ
jgi:hypothetical protein